MGARPRTGDYPSAPQASSSPAKAPRLGIPYSVEAEGYHCEILYVGKPFRSEMLLQILQDVLCLVFHTSDPKPTIRGRAL